MTKKIISVIMILVMLVNVAACGQKEPEDITMPAPDKLSKDVTITELDNGVKLYNGYLCIDIGGKYSYCPYVKDKKDGVMYADDNAYRLVIGDKTYENKKKVIKEYNKPSGCVILSEANRQCSMLSTGNIAIPEFTGVVRTEEGEKARALYIHRNYTTFSGDFGADAVYSTSTKLRDVDVQAVSVALYEDFYEEIPQFTMEIYAVTKELARQKLGAEYEMGKAGDIVDVYGKDYSDYELISSTKINKTDVYYIDWKSIDSNEDYLFYIVALDWEYVSDCECIIEGSNIYDIEDEAAYQEWKKTNKDKFIAG